MHPLVAMLVSVRVCALMSAPLREVPCPTVRAWGNTSWVRNVLALERGIEQMMILLHPLFMPDACDWHDGCCSWQHG